MVRGPGWRAVVLALLSLGAAGCALLSPLPEPQTLNQRLASFPVDGLPLDAPATVYWDRHLIPLIHAQTDHDLAFVLGLAHAHLRLAQMELLRRAAQGRLAELFGPPLVKIDASIRILDFGRAADDMAAGLPPDTRQWLESFLAGVNHYQDRMDRRPHEFKVWGIRRPEPYTLKDLLTVSRLLGTDINWMIYFQMLGLWGTDAYQPVWDRLLRSGAASLPSFEGPAALASLLAGASKSGSNCLAVSSTKTGTDSAMLAADPHLGLTLPNMWLVAGGRSPSYHMVGLMFPGLPFAGVGRNPHAAWGGTNMRAASSDLYDVSGLSPGEFQVRRETIRIRWWPDKTITIRDTNWGPVISDAPVFRKYTGPPLALNWMGHRPSDELTSFLDAARAESFRDFRRAFQGYAVSGQNMLYADDKGHIGQVLAVRLPIRPADRPPDLILDPDDPASGWRGAVDAADLPAAYDPPAGFLASANNLPVKNNPPVGFLYRDNDRIRRMTALMDRAETVDFRTLAAVQRDVLSPVAIDLRDALVGLAEDRRLAPKAHEPAAELWSRLTGWDGAYRLDSRGAPAFEILVYYFSRAYYAETIGPRAAETLTQSMDLIEILVLDLKRDRRRGDLDAAAGALALALDLAPSDAARRPVWADMHRVELAHVFGRLPLVGRKYRLVEFAAPGSRSTLYKTAQNVDNKPHTAAYGSNARFICDLSDINENYFVLLGGQDGRPGGRRTVDQVPIWRRGEYIRVPLDFSRAGETFEYRLDLKPNR